MKRDHFPVVVHVLLRRGDEVLLLRRCNTGYMDGWWAAPGGHMEWGEDPTSTAIRECREEAGVTIASDDLEPLAAMPYRSAQHQGVDFLFVCRRWTGAPHIAEPRRFDAIGWHPLDALPAEAAPYLTVAFDLARRGRWFHEFLSS